MSSAQGSLIRLRIRMIVDGSCGRGARASFSSTGSASCQSGRTWVSARVEGRSAACIPGKPRAGGQVGPVHPGSHVRCSARSQDCVALVRQMVRHRADRGERPNAVPARRLRTRIPWKMVLKCTTWLPRSTRPAQPVACASMIQCSAFAVRYPLPRSLNRIATGRLLRDEST